MPVRNGGGYEYDDVARLGIQPVGAGDWVRILVFSPPSWGKTSIWGTAAAAGMKTLIIRSTVDQMPSRIMQSGAEMVIAETWEKMFELQDYLRMANHGYVWVFWDNVSTHQDVLLDDVWDGTIAVNPKRQFIVDEQGRSTGKPNLTPTSGLDKGEYGRNMELIQRWVRHMVGCNSFHFGIGAHPFEGRHPTNPEGDELLVPWVQGKMMAEKISGYCNMIGFLELKENKDQTWRRLHFRENNQYYAKDLYDAFLEKGYMDIMNSTPTIPQIMAAIEKARGRPLGNTPTTPTPTRRRGRR